MGPPRGHLHSFSHFDTSFFMPFLAVLSIFEVWLTHKFALEHVNICQLKSCKGQCNDEFDNWIDAEISMYEKASPRSQTLQVSQKSTTSATECAQELVCRQEAWTAHLGSAIFWRSSHWAQTCGVEVCQVKMWFNRWKGRHLYKERKKSMLRFKTWHNGFCGDDAWSLLGWVL